MKVSIALLLFSTFSQAFTWPSATPDEVNMDAAKIDAAISQIETGNYGAIRSLVVIRNGKLITEKYFGNNGEKRPVYSVTKSIGSTLLGIAKHQGADINIDESIMTYFPQYSNIPNADQVQLVTLHDLLTQRHGYLWDEWVVPYGDFNNPVSQMLRSADWYLTALQWPIVQIPDQDFAYSTGHSSLMSPILQNRTGRDVYEFATSELFNPLDITDTHWELINGGGVQGQGITQFPFGIEPLGFGLWLKPIDMAKIGELFRLKGMWEGKRILAEDWVTQSVQLYSNGDTDPDVFTGQYSGYGYQWWGFRFIDSIGRSADAFYANGYGRQFIMVIPAYDAIIVSTADDYNHEGPGIGTVMRENLLAAFKTEENQTVAITSDLNGSWYWPENSGQGINIEILDNGTRLWGYWYTYHAESGNQRWFTLQGTIENNLATFDIVTTSEGGFVESDPPTVTLWGTGSAEFYGCLNGLFKFDSPGENVNGEIPLTRLTASTGSCLPGNNKASKDKYYIH